MTVPPPLALLAEITHHCPMRCLYCSNPLALEPARRELPTALWCRVLSEAANLGVLQVHFSGGEPTARPDLVRLVEHAVSRGLYTNLITSGILLDGAKVMRLRDAGLEHVQLSLQDVDAATGNRIGGLAGAHERKLTVAGSVVDAGLALTVNAVIHRHNAARVAKISISRSASAPGGWRSPTPNTTAGGWPTGIRCCPPATRSTKRLPLWKRPGDA